MVEMKDDPKYPCDADNQVPLYSAVWERAIEKNGKIVRKTLCSSWRKDQASAVVLAIKNNGHIVRGYFGGFAF